jgi:hypothetical protein
MARRFTEAGGAAAKVVTGIYTTLAYTAICSIRLTGVDVLD